MRSWDFLVSNLAILVVSFVISKKTWGCLTVFFVYISSALLFWLGSMIYSQRLPILFYIPIFWLWGYLMTVIPEMRRAHYIGYLRFFYYHRINTAACELYVHASIIHPVVSVSVVKFCIRHNYVWNFVSKLYSLSHHQYFQNMILIFIW